jgi:putative methionine-R-sulfoxide reductase with GAF domain
MLLDKTILKTNILPERFDVILVALIVLYSLVQYLFLSKSNNGKDSEGNRIGTNASNTNTEEADSSEKDESSFKRISDIEIAVKNVTGFTTLEEYSDKILISISKKYEIVQAYFYTLNQEDQTYFMTGSYGQVENLEKIVKPGQGLIGRVIEKKQVFIINEIDKEPIIVQSGTGEGKPNCLCILPILKQDNLLGLIEIYSFQKVGDNISEYSEGISNIIGDQLLRLMNKS